MKRPGQHFLAGVLATITGLTLVLIVDAQVGAQEPGAVAAVGAPRSPSPSAVVHDTRIDSILGAMLAREGLPGGAAALITPDSIRVGVAGVRRLGDSSKVDLADRFHIGSNTKAMTATLIARAIERGVLTWNTRPADLFAELRDSVHSTLKSVTLTMLMRMRGGIEPYTAGEEFNKLPRAVFTGTPTEQRRKFADYLLRRGPFSPVGDFSYSNASYAIVAAMAEQAFGRPWEQLLPEYVGQPLAISIAYGWPAKTSVAEPWGHWLRDDNLVPHDPNGRYQLLDLVAPGGAVSLSIQDFATFVQFNLRGLLGNDGLIRATSMVALHEAEGPYAMGWNHMPSTGPAGSCAPAVFGDSVVASAHTGSAGTFYSFATVIPSKRIAVAVMTNAFTPGVGLALNGACTDPSTPVDAVNSRYRRGNCHIKSMFAARHGSRPTKQQPDAGPAATFGAPREVRSDSRRDPRPGSACHPVRPRPRSGTGRPHF